MLKVRNKEHMAEVFAWAMETDNLPNLVKLLNYLNSYADGEMRGDTIVEVGKDFADKSFGLMWYERKSWYEVDHVLHIPTKWDKAHAYCYVPWMNGAADWRDDEKNWSVHT